MGETTDTPATPEAFLRELTINLMQSEGADTDLVKILADFILQVSPPDDAVVKASSAIQKLATERAVSPKPEVAND